MWYKSWSIVRVRQIQKLRTDTRHCLFPAPLGIDLILYVTRSDGAFMPTCLNLITTWQVYFPIRSMGASGTHAEPLYIHVPGTCIWFVWRLVYMILKPICILTLCLSVPYESTVGTNYC